MHISCWPSFKARLIGEFGSSNIFGFNTKGIFNLLPHYKPVQEVAEDLTPKIKTLQTSLEIIKDFHDMENL